MYDDDFDLIAEAEQDESDEGEEGGDTAIEIENSFYEGKDLLGSKPPDLKGALAAFEKVIELEKKVDQSEWSFQALEEIVKIKITLNKNDQVVPKFKELLSYSTKVTENNLLKSTNNILEEVSKSDNKKLISDMYETSLEVLKKKNQRLWFKIYLRLGKVQVDNADKAGLEKTIKDLWGWANSADSKKARPTDRIEIYSLEIQAAELTKDRARIKEVYQKAEELIANNPDILDSKLSLFKFIGGKLKLEEGDPDEAYSMLFEAFKYYVKIIGSDKTKPCVTYLIIANMLKREWNKAEKTLSPFINPFDSEQLQHLKGEKDIKPFAELHEAYQKLKFVEFQKVLSKKKDLLDSDSFIAQFKEQIFTKLYQFSTLQMLKPYSNLRLDFIAGKLDISKDKIEQLLVELILDNYIAGRIDQINGVLLLDGETDEDKYRSMERWATQLQSVTQNLVTSIG